SLLTSHSSRAFLKRLEGPLSNFMMCVVNCPRENGEWEE
ncbi:MAG: hypothetical protein XD79_0818, partial [Atribacteria bacterium 34_128]